MKYWFGCRGCGWISDLSVCGKVHVNGRCQFCNYDRISIFTGTTEEYHDMKMVGLTPTTPIATTDSW